MKRTLCRGGVAAAATENAAARASGTSSIIEQYFKFIQVTDEKRDRVIVCILNLLHVPPTWAQPAVRAASWRREHQNGVMLD
jgi:hypothetical protein